MLSKSKRSILEQILQLQVLNPLVTFQRQGCQKLDALLFPIYVALCCIYGSWIVVWRPWETCGATERGLQLVCSSILHGKSARWFVKNRCWSNRNAHIRYIHWFKQRSQTRSLPRNTLRIPLSHLPLQLPVCSCRPREVAFGGCQTLVTCWSF